MEAGAFAGAPAMTEGDQQVEQQVEQTQPPAPEQAQSQQQGGGEEPKPDDVLSAIRGLEERIDGLAQAQQPPSEEPVDLLTALQGDPELAEYGGQQFDPQQEAPGQQFEDPQAQQELDALRSLIHEEAQALTAPLVEREQKRELDAIEQQYPDITSPAVMDKLRPLMSQLAEEAGNPDLVDNPAIVRMAYRAVKAELADAGAVPAEQAATQGASLETNAGGSQAGTVEPSLVDQYKSLVYDTHRKAEF